MHTTIVLELEYRLQGAKFKNSACSPINEHTEQLS